MPVIKKTPIEISNEASKMDKYTYYDYVAAVLLLYLFNLIEK